MKSILDNSKISLFHTSILFYLSKVVITFLSGRPIKNVPVLYKRLIYVVTYILRTYIRKSRAEHCQNFNNTPATILSQARVAFFIFISCKRWSISCATKNLFQ